MDPAVGSGNRTVAEGRRAFAGTDAIFWLTVAVLIASFLLGGGTRDGFLSDVILQLVSIPLLLAALLRSPELMAARQTRAAVLFAVAVAAVPLLQLIPLPPSVWTRLPNRELLAESYALMGSALPWRPISVQPDATALSALSLVPPMAVFLAVLLLGYRGRRWLSIVAVAIGVIAAFIGLIQVAQGPASALRFFTISHSGEATGFFANRNHFAALLYCLTLLLTAWAIDSTFQAGERRGQDPRALPSFVLIMAAVVALVVLLGALTMARSRAGLALAIGALAGAFAMALSDRRGAAGSLPMKVLLGAVVLVTVFAVQFALYRILQRFSVDPLADVRLVFAQRTLEAAKAYWPFGSGVGTFVPVYATFERAQDVTSGLYVNRAHNDLLELGLESGAAGLTLLALFLLWLLYRCVSVWWGDLPGSKEIDRSLARAASIFILLLLVHSLVDYPLRTGAMMCVFAFGCALLVEPLRAGRREADVSARDPVEAPFDALGAEQPWGHPPWPVQTPELAPAPDPARPAAGGLWGEDIEWPEVWRKPPKK